jgi:S1-C subfamily serine protease
VLIVTPDALGSGAIVGRDGTIVTNWHVVEGSKTVGVIFKPQNTDTKIRESDAVQAKVLRIDQIADLAIIKVSSIPSDANVIALGDPAKLSIGADVHAIGHPLGEVWSYTKGIVSQIRHDYDWTYPDSPVKHRADVVQTQTPINPGNSGGPLLNDAGELVGISTFGEGQGAQINFAIASNEVARFLRDTGDRLAPNATVAAAPPAPSSKACEPVTLGRYRTKNNDGTIIIMDGNCNGKADAMLSIPDDKSKGILFALDENENGVLEAIYVDENSDLKFDYVLFDTNEDGKTDLVGYDLDDNLEPGRVETVRA